MTLIVVSTLIALPVLAIAFRPLLIRLLPEDTAGPDGWVFDTENGTGILDFGPARR